MVNVTIDGKNIEVPEGTTVLRAAQMAGVTIPTLCDHPNLTPYGGCRLCLVEVEGARTLQPSCTLPVNNNIVVHTDTQKVLDARKFVLTLLFSERNHFCMYCQVSGGDCELQNAAYGEGMTHWPLQPNWSPYPVDASHPYFILENNRCILCRRCVRACSELVGNFTLGIEERGAKSVLVADLGTPLGESTCVSCGVCVQICPTGALIDRRSAYQGRETQTEVTQSVCLGCSLGCGIDVHTRDNRLVRIEGDWDAQVNGGVLCEAGRFLPMNEDRERVTTPMLRKNGALKAATWEEALDAIAASLKPLAGKNGDGVAAMASTRLPAEALSAFEELFAEKLGSHMVTSIEEGVNTAASAAVAAELGQPFEGGLDAFDSADCVVAIDVDLASEHQVAGFFIKRALPKGVKLVTVDTQPGAFKDLADYAVELKAGGEAGFLNGLKAALAGSVPSSKETGVPATVIQDIAGLIGAAQKPLFVYGKALAHKDTAALKALVELAGALPDKRAVILSPKGEANSLAASQYGLDGAFKVNGHQAAFIALGDDRLSQRQLKLLEGIPFLVVQASYISTATAAADVVLPVEDWVEQSGHYVSLDGRLQTAQKALAAPEGVLSNEAALQAVAKSMGFELDGDWKAKLSRRTSPVAIAEA